MAIKQFNITDYKGIKNAESTGLKQLMVIAGPNGVGKSTLLERLSFALHGMSVTGSEIKFDPKSISIYFGPHRTPQHLRLHKYTPQDEKIITEGDYFGRMGNFFYGQDSKFQTIPEAIKTNSWRTATSADFAPYLEIKRTLVDLETEIKEFVFNKLKKDEIVKKDELYDIIGPVNQVIQQFLPHIQFKEIILDEKANFSINFTNKYGQTIEFDYLSSGEKEIISFFFPIIYFKIIKRIKSLKNEPMPSLDLVFLIDTPEEHLHPHLQLNFIRYIKKLLTSREFADLKMQFIICTHSHFIITESAQHLFIMDFPKPQVDNQLIDSTDLKDNDELNLLLGNLGLVAIASGRPIILVEGPMDVDILSIFFESINRQCTLLPMSGKGQIYNIIATLERIIEKLDKEGIKLHAIVDKDRGKNSLSKIGRIQVLPVNCLENFLISDFDCVYEALKVTIGQNALKTIGSGKQVGDLLEQIINSSELKNFEIATRLNESLSFHISTEKTSLTEDGIMAELEKIYNTKKSRLPNRIKEVTTLVDDYVNNKNYRELNGKNIIRSLAARYNVNAEILTRTLASCIMNKQGNPPAELLTILKTIVSDTTIFQP